MLRSASFSKTQTQVHTCLSTHSIESESKTRLPEEQPAILIHKLACKFQISAAKLAGIYWNAYDRAKLYKTASVWLCGMDRLTCQRSNGKHELLQSTTWLSQLSLDPQHTQHEHTRTVELVPVHITIYKPSTYKFKNVTFTATMPLSNVQITMSNDKFTLSWFLLRRHPYRALGGWAYSFIYVSSEVLYDAVYTGPDSFRQYI